MKNKKALKTNKFLTIHGHFYQPPRENPWTGMIGIQPSAAPFTDWNERVFAEAYQPNAFSRILSPEGRIEKLVNNYEYMSFNFGPTLMSWIRKNHPNTYQAIVEGDQKSQERLGHGNAIAQVYNHIIMPLASQKDRLTQIRWAKDEFRFHFNRDPEAMWLAETAINQDTVVDLINEGIKYVILAPTQAGRVRKLGMDGDWTHVESHTIDTAKPYRVLPRGRDGEMLCEGHLDVFFYNGWLSSAVSFEHLLRDAQTFGTRIGHAFNQGNDIPQLCSISTDGESYGHHEPFGDMCAAYLFERILPEDNIDVVNYAWYLEHFPPQDEVELANTYDEGTAWSCAHGVGRWYRDCGCQTGGDEFWDQKWRTPMRLSLNELKHRIDLVFVKEIHKYTDVEPWKLRDAYVEVLIDIEDEQRRDSFLKKYLKDPTNRSHCSAVLQLLEMQKFSLFSFTSCGWFFNDVEGLEPVHNLKYARRALEIYIEFSGDKALEEDFLHILNEMTSNENKLTGKQIYQQMVLPRINPDYQLIAGAIFDPKTCPQETCSKEVGVFSIHGRKIKRNDVSTLWEVELFNHSLLTSKKYLAIALRDSFSEDVIVIYDSKTPVEKIPFPENPPAAIRDIYKMFREGVPVRLKDLFSNDLQKITDKVAQRSFEHVCEEFSDFPVRHNIMYGLMDQTRVNIPEHLMVPLRMSLVAEMYKIFKNYHEGFSEDDMHALRDLSIRAGEAGVKVTMDWIAEPFQEYMAEKISAVNLKTTVQEVSDITALIVAAEYATVPLDRQRLENIAWEIYPEWAQKRESGEADGENLIHFFGYLNFHLPELGKK